MFIDLEESQMEFTAWYAQWLDAFRRGEPRDTSLAIAGGDRRGGKTFDLLFCTIATCLEVPRLDGSNLVAWTVSCNYQERDELDRTIHDFIPSAWYHHQKAPEFRYTFVPGSSLRNISADNPETLKRGRVDVVFYNEAQKIKVAALSNGIYGTVDKGGIALLAANPPRHQVGEWVLTLKQAIEEKELAGARFFGFSSKDNEQIAHDARGRVGAILRFIDPKAAQADDDGAWLPVGDRAYPAWNKTRNVGTVPELGDVTMSFTKKRHGRAFPFVAGLDFQAWPHHCAVMVRIFPGEDGPIYWFADEVVSEQCTEDELIDDILERGYESTDLLCVGDASGAWQDGKHEFRGRVSFDFFKSRRFFIEPPQRPRADSKTNRSRNPAVEDRLSLMYRLMEQGRIMVDPARCPRLVAAFKDCELKGLHGALKPYGRHAHITDAAGYVLWYLEPKPTRPRMVGTAPPAITIPIVRRGSDVI